MRLQDTISTRPLQTEQTTRRENISGITSGEAGKTIPLKYFPVMREESVSGSMSIRFDMMETAERLLNAVKVTCYAYFVPYLASDRFNGMDQLNRSYMGQPEVEGGSVVPFFPQDEYRAGIPFYKTLGLHAPYGTMVNGFPIEAYNIIANHRRKARSNKLPLRDWDNGTLARSFWNHPQMGHIVPDFDQAMIDGEVELNIIDAKLPISGLGVGTAATTSNPTPTITTTNGNEVFPNGYRSDNWPFFMKADGQDGQPDVWAELKNAGVKASLANIELTKQTASFAKLRKKYEGLSDDYIVDLLMEGVRVPDEALSQPILLDKKQTVFGMSQRYATDGASLDTSVTRGETVVDMRFRTPKMNTGGVVMVIAEIVPEQMFERQKDHFLYATSRDDLPNFTKDFLDPEKVDIVTNDEVDVLHTVPTGTFGYAPLNSKWNRQLVNVGGKYHRPTTNTAFDEERQKFWAVETLDPSLTEDFYLVSELHNKVFADTTVDPFEISFTGGATMVGNTVFGKRLEEDSEDYEIITAMVDTDRIDQGA